MTQMLNEKRSKIRFTYDLAPILLRRLLKKVDPTWPYASSSALYYMPLRAMTPDTRNYFGQQEVWQPSSQPTFGRYQSSQVEYLPRRLPSLVEETFESQSQSQSNQSTKYDKWTNEQHKYLIIWSCTKRIIFNNYPAKSRGISSDT